MSQAVQHPLTRQGVGFIVLSAICALVAATLAPKGETGLLALGVGMLLASALAPWRAFLVGTTVTPFALVNVSWSIGLLPGGWLYGAYVLAAALGMTVALLAARRGLVGQYPLSPSVILAAIGLLLIGTTFSHTQSFFGFFVSWWMPAVVFLGMGIVRFVRRV